MAGPLAVPIFVRLSSPQFKALSRLQSDLSHRVTLPGGRTITVRPIKAQGTKGGKP